MISLNRLLPNLDFLESLTDKEGLEKLNKRKVNLRFSVVEEFLSSAGENNGIIVMKTDAVAVPTLVATTPAVTSTTPACAVGAAVGAGIAATAVAIYTITRALGRGGSSKDGSSKDDSSDGGSSGGGSSSEKTTVCGNTLICCGSGNREGCRKKEPRRGPPH